eukprot:Plantae.Rhodophyta-Purpureofilum_apyrenoidigerum.ctg18306.p1 GENE.Plantae.Rhodophyta-Purpureofilum_apyrenoidigerum.ctg18306~~Plantae.Rhodophyta-Purpureofilum_apyrenoidigerum.ctg18306.p1  ORF type:complete len:370 (+),score=67.78 Plantae.Rhodophyta-Purpureofilum_apyrenoidigerum.ctg18306:175-1284(+)
MIDSRISSETDPLDSIDQTSLTSTDFLLENHLKHGGSFQNSEELDLFLQVENFGDCFAEEEDLDVRTKMESDMPLFIENLERMESFAEGSMPESPSFSRKRSPSESEVEQPEAGSPKPQRRKQAHNEHSRRYRANVGTKFRELSDLVAELETMEDMKNPSKSKVLQLSIKLMKQYKKEINSLSIDVAMSSRRNMLDWVDQIVEMATSLCDVLQPMMNLICNKRSWKYGETWMPTENASSTIVLRLKSALVSPLDGSTAASIERFRENSRTFSFLPGVGLIGRVFNSLRAENVMDPSESSKFVRSEIALRHGVAACFAVPIVVGGNCAAVVAFCDTEKRVGDVESINLANNIANYIGNAYGAKLAKKSSA